MEKCLKGLIVSWSLFKSSSFKPQYTDTNDFITYNIFSNSQIPTDTILSSL
ncbi:hypothetical protein HPHPA17_0024 [Helicobacter pylori Hp A-17]|nr:hypothetical protein HPHPA17_0024 [Helicobacter pylori Hp A-17]